MGIPSTIKLVIDDERQTEILTITPEWFAGFVDGEGSIGIASHGQEYLQPRFRLNQRDDDGEIVRAIHRFVGTGHLAAKRQRPGTKSYLPNARPQICFNVIGRDCVAVVQILDVAPLRSKKRHEYPIWRRAVMDYANNLSTRWADPEIKRSRDRRMRSYKTAIEAAREYGGSR